MVSHVWENCKHVSVNEETIIIELLKQIKVS